MSNDSKPLPKPLTEQYNAEYLKDDFHELQEKSLEAFDKLKITADKAEAVEEATTGQSYNKVWFEQRARRVTASKFKAACSTNPDKPSKSCINMTRYPDAHHFSNAATKRGISNESKAVETYEFSIAEHHLNLSVADSGLHINEK